MVATCIIDRREINFTLIKQRFCEVSHPTNVGARPIFNLCEQCTDVSWSAELVYDQEHWSQSDVTYYTLGYNNDVVATALPRVTAGGWAPFVRRTFLSGLYIGLCMGMCRMLWRWRMDWMARARDHDHSTRTYRFATVTRPRVNGLLLDLPNTTQISQIQTRLHEQFPRSFSCQ